MADDDGASSMMQLIQNVQKCKILELRTFCNFSVVLHFHFSGLSEGYKSIFQVCQSRQY